MYKLYSVKRLIFNGSNREKATWSFDRHTEKFIDYKGHRLLSVPRIKVK